MPTPPPKPRQPAPIPAAEYRALLQSGKQAADAYKATRPAQPAGPDERLRTVAQQAANAHRAHKAASPANLLTKAVLQLLTLHGFTVWRQNNAAVYDPKREVFRAGSSTKGIADVLGYHRATGIMCAVEVKAGSDRLSPEQRRFLAGIKDAGGFACEARDIAQVEAELKIYLATLPIT